MSQSKHKKNMQHEDAVLKAATTYFKEKILPILGIDETFAESTYTELRHFSINKYYMDFTFLTQNGDYIHIEFQSTDGGVEDLQRFHVYESVLRYETGRSVTTYVIFSGDIKNPICEDTYGINTYKVNPICLSDKDSDPIFEALEYKKTHGESFSEEDLATLSLTPLMGGSLTKTDKIMKAISLLNGSSGTSAQRTVALIYTFAEKFLSNDDLEKIKEALNMTRLGQMIFDDGYSKGVSIGISQSADIITQIKAGVPIEKIAQNFNIEKKAIRDMKTAMES